MDDEREQRRLTEFLESGGDKLFRDLIQYHMKKSSPQKMQDSVLSEVLLLPENLQKSVESLIDSINNIFFSPDFESVKGWELITCREAYEAIIEDAIERFPKENFFSSIEESLLPENQSMAFGLFNIIVINFSINASMTRDARKFMGIRKGLFG